MTCPNDTNDSGNIPCWSISTWIYKDYPGAATDEQTGIFNQTNWLNKVQSYITSYNAAQISPTSKITQIYPYASDLELPWVSPSFAGNGTTPEPLFDNPPATQTCTATQCFNQMPVAPTTLWSQSDPTQGNCQYGLDFVSTTNYAAAPSGGVVPSLPANPTPANQLADTTPVPPSLTITNLNIPQMAVIIDGRIDNGYLQGLNEFLTPADAVNLAKLIVNGGYSQIPLNIPNPAYVKGGTMPKYLPGNSNFQVGVGTFGPQASNKYTPTINGIQLDLEPFDSTNPNQVAFYNEIGALLKGNGQYYSIFTFPKAMTAATAAILNSSNNGYMIVALYDLVDMHAGIPAVCNADYTFTGAPCDTSAAPPPVVASGDATTAIFDPTVPHSLTGYYNAVLLSVKQTIAKAALTGIKYKFGIPVSSSVHEFEGWGQYVCQFNDFVKVKPINGFCRMYNGLPMNINSGSPSQLGYVQMAIKGMQDGISQMGSTFTDNAHLFRGVDLYAFSYRTIWSPQNPVVDFVTGNVFYGNTPVYVPANADGYSAGSLVNPPYTYSVPGYPTYSNSDYTNNENILNWLATYGVDPRPATCGSGTCLPSQCCKGACCPAGGLCIGSGEGTCCIASQICGTGSAATCCPAGQTCKSGTCSN